MRDILTRRSGRTFAFFFASAAEVAENGLVACSEVRGLLSPRIDVGVLLAALLKCGIEGRDIEWTVGVLKALARDASIGVRDRMVVVVWCGWLGGSRVWRCSSFGVAKRFRGRKLSFAAREGGIIDRPLARA